MMKGAEKYLEALREAVGEERFSLAVAQLKMARDEFSLDRRRELAGLHSNEARVKKLNEWFGDFLAPEVKNFITLLASKNELSLLDSLESGGDGVKEWVVVTTARPLPKELRGRYSEELESVFPGVRVQFAEDAALIGGVKIKVGDREVDNSIRARLTAIAK